MRIVSLALASCLAVGCSQPQAGKASLDELGQSVVAGLTAKDVAGLNGLIATPEQAIGACPRLESERKTMISRRADAEAALSASFATCLKSDWKGAAVLSVKGGGAKRALEGCPDYVEMKDVTITAEVAKQERIIRIEDPVSLGGQFFLFGGIQCAGGESSDPSVNATLAAVDALCACKDMACADAAAGELSKQFKETPLQNVSPADAKLIGKATQRMAECRKQLIAQQVKAAPAPAAAGQRRMLQPPVSKQKQP